MLNPPSAFKISLHRQGGEFFKFFPAYPAEGADLFVRDTSSRCKIGSLAATKALHPPVASLGLKRTAGLRADSVIRRRMLV